MNFPLAPQGHRQSYGGQTEADEQLMISQLLGFIEAKGRAQALSQPEITCYEVCSQNHRMSPSKSSCDLNGSLAPFIALGINTGSRCLLQAVNNYKQLSKLLSGLQPPSILQATPRGYIAKRVRHLAGAKLSSAGDSFFQRRADCYPTPIIFVLDIPLIALSPCPPDSLFAIAHRRCLSLCSSPVILRSSAPGAEDRPP